jgi:asparagine N-glycosylation enzyme membrane subunit Stt3
MLAEIALKLALGVNWVSLVAPTLVAMAMPTALPATRIKDMSTKLNIPLASGYKVQSSRDEHFCYLVWLFIISTFACWVWIYFTINKSPPQDVLSAPTIIGMFFYVISHAITGVKKWI